MQASWRRHTHTHTHTHTVRHTHYKDLLLFAHTQTLHPLRPPCVSLLGPLVPMAMCGQRCLGGGGVGSRAEPPSLLPVPPGPVCIHAHTQRSSPSLARLLIDSAVYKPPPLPLFLLLSSSTCRAHLLFISYLILHSTFKLRGRRQAYPRPCLWWQRKCIHSGPGRGCEVGSLAGWSSPCHALKTQTHTKIYTSLTETFLLQ